MSVHTSRLRPGVKGPVVDAVAGEVRAVDRVAAQFGVSWPTVQRLSAMPLPRSSTGDGRGHAWAHRLLLLRGYNTLSERGESRSSCG